MTKIKNWRLIQGKICILRSFKNVSSPGRKVSKSRCRDASRRLRNAALDNWIVEEEFWSLDSNMYPVSCGIFFRFYLNVSILFIKLISIREVCIRLLYSKLSIYTDKGRKNETIVLDVKSRERENINYRVLAFCPENSTWISIEFELNCASSSSLFHLSFFTNFFSDLWPF